MLSGLAAVILCLFVLFYWLHFDVPPEVRIGIGTLPIIPGSIGVSQLKAVGLGERMYNFPGQLSGGEQQRVAIARALAKNPKLLLCDEPTGALDYNTGKQILQLLQDQAHNSGATVIIITHNKAITPMGDRVISVRSGRVQDVKINENPVPVSEIEW